MVITHLFAGGKPAALYQHVQDAIAAKGRAQEHLGAALEAPLSAPATKAL